MSAYLWLLPTVRIARVADRAVELFSATGGVHVDRIGGTVLELAELLDGTRTEEDISAQPGARPILDFLDERGWLVRLRSPLDVLETSAPARTRQLSYYAHVQPTHPDRAFDQLASKKVLVIGVGGIGTHACLVLAGGGVRRFVLNDFDRVDASNLNRQVLFHRADIGRHKAEILRERLLDRFDGLEIEVDTANHDDQDSDTIPDVDLVLLCGESMRFHDQPGRLGTTPLLIAGYFGRVGAVGPLVSPHHGTACWKCIVEHTGRADYERVESNEVSRPRAWNSSGSGINTVMGGLLGEAALRFLAPALGEPLLLGRRLQLDLGSLETSDVHAPISRCPHTLPGSNTHA